MTSRQGKREKEREGKATITKQFLFEERGRRRSWIKWAFTLSVCRSLSKFMHVVVRSQHLFREVGIKYTLEIVLTSYSENLWFQLHCQLNNYTKLGHYSTMLGSETPSLSCHAMLTSRSPWLKDVLTFWTVLSGSKAMSGTPESNMSEKRFRNKLAELFRDAHTAFDT